MQHDPGSSCYTMRTMTSLRALVLLCSLFIQPDARAADVLLGIGGMGLRVELAATAQDRAHGLMGRTTLCADCGMLFVFEGAGRHEFWMEDTQLPLSVAFIAEDGRILNIEEMLPGSTQRHGSRGAALYALEMNRGWFARHGIMPGDKVLKLQGLRAPKAR